MNAFFRWPKLKLLSTKKLTYLIKTTIDKRSTVFFSGLLVSFFLTAVCVGALETGVANAAEAAINTTIAYGYGDTFVTTAILIAIGAIRTALAVLERKRLNRDVIINKTLITRYGLEVSIEAVRALTIKSIPPVFCKASASGNIPAIKIKLLQ